MGKKFIQEAIKKPGEVITGHMVIRKDLQGLRIHFSERSIQKLLNRRFLRVRKGKNF